MQHNSKLIFIVSQLSKSNISLASFGHQFVNRPITNRSFFHCRTTPFGTGLYPSSGTVEHGFGILLSIIIFLIFTKLHFHKLLTTADGTVESLSYSALMPSFELGFRRDKGCFIDDVPEAITHTPDHLSSHRFSRRRNHRLGLFYCFVVFSIRHRLD